MLDMIDRYEVLSSIFFLL